jgi:hypothetical protein
MTFSLVVFLLAGTVSVASPEPGTFANATVVSAD